MWLGMFELDLLCASIMFFFFLSDVFTLELGVHRVRKSSIQL